jgi:putative drug exporter of the RND superfamily
MRQPQSSVLPESRPPGHRPRRGRARAPIVERIAAWSARHRKTAIFGWLGLVIGAFAVGQLLSAPNLPQYDAGQSGQAEHTLQRLGVTSPPAESVLVQARAPGATWATDPAMRTAVRQVAAALRAQPRSAAGVRSPLGAAPGGGSGGGGGGSGGGSGGLVSADGRAALVTFTVPGPLADEDQRVVPDLHAVAAVQARYPGLKVAEAGDASGDRAIGAQIGRDFHRAELTSVPITLVLLLIAFGALIAAGIPLLLAASAVVTAISLLAIPGHWLPVGSSTSEVVLLIGMAVGVDYSLFYLRREREERAAGASNAEALRTAARTSGRAIVVSGLTVMIALAGLFLTGYAVFTGIAIGTIVVVGVAVAGSVTVLPAVLSLLGSKADRGRIPFLGRRRTAARPSRVWAALVRRVVRRPVLWGGIAVVGMLALGVPALGLRLANPPDGGAPASLPIVATLNQIQRAFPGSPEPAQVVVTAGTRAELAGAPVQREIARLRADAAGPTGRRSVHGPVTVTSVAGGRALILDVPLAGNGTDAGSTPALLALRSRILPATLGQVPGVSYAVAGDIAEDHDDIAILDSRTPLVFAVVAILAVLLLLMAFRSATIALLSVGLNLLSAVAAFGVLTFVFQDGHFQGPLNFTSYGGIVPWIPLFIFVFLFGLSMDYHVFLLSRIRELRDRGARSVDAVVGGISSSAGVVTSAALIMVAVFSIFATLSLIQLKMLGVCLAVAILIDATVVRGILLPAALALLGDRAWRRLPWSPDRPATQARPAPAVAAGGPDTGGLGGGLDIGAAADVVAPGGGSLRREQP